MQFTSLADGGWRMADGGLGVVLLAFGMPWIGASAADVITVSAIIGFTAEMMTLIHFFAR
ncbi:hypothetical protein [Actinomadura algeriensis]|uniref:Uncharacterized protein n=1 Tax=Actinomadura algeriensis TaxID=1679523 RepID=A0ABR9JS34_9ACTN|nr:hypothetical protein [Actinomadura algeriensis]MBE1533342.1 hypothetical protein [Actinomadura algeriensis]